MLVLDMKLKCSLCILYLNQKSYYAVFVIKLYRTVVLIKKSCS